MKLYIEAAPMHDWFTILLVALVLLSELPTLFCCNVRSAPYFAAGDNKTDAEGEQEDEAIEIVMDGNESGSALEFEIEEEEDNSSGAFSIQEDDSDLE